MDNELTENKVNGRVKLALFVLYCLAVVAVFFEVNAILGLLMLPVLGYGAARYLVNSAFDWLPGFMRKRAYGKWQGRYFEFDGRQVRADEFKGLDKAPLLSSEDLSACLGLRGKAGLSASVKPDEGGLAGIPCVNASEALRWAKRVAGSRPSCAEQAGRLALWIERSFVVAHEKSCESAGRSAPNPELWAMPARKTPSA